jgi:L-amino acid N-acyltransferase YncA
MVSIRAATVEDAVAISHVHVESWRATYKGIVPEEHLSSLSEAEHMPLWRKWLALEVQAFIAAMNGEVVGFACGGRIREPLHDYDAELFAIYLLPRAQGHGLGSALLKTLADALRAQGFKSMAAWVLLDNSSSTFYRKTGAVPVSQKETQIGSATLPVIAFGWPDLELLS